MTTTTKKKREERQAAPPDGNGAGGSRGKSPGKVQVYGERVCSLLRDDADLHHRSMSAQASFLLEGVYGLNAEAAAEVLRKLGEAEKV